MRISTLLFFTAAALAVPAIAGDARPEALPSVAPAPAVPAAPAPAYPPHKPMRLAQAATTPPIDPAAISEWANSVALATADRTLLGMFPNRVRKPLIVSTTERDAGTLSQLEEDLNVMMRILEKSTNTKDDTKVLGIDVLSGGSSPRVLYIDSYGALFLLRVRYPLLAPSAKADLRTNETTSSEWEKARQEIYGRGRVGEKFGYREGPAEEFDAERVEKLQEQLCDDLVNATHIRSLKPDEYVTVVVSGTGARRGQAVVRQESSTKGGRATSEIFQSSDSTQSTMTIRARKADLDALAKGVLKREGLKKKLSIQVY